MFINKIILYGNLVRDPELRTLPSGSSVCSFTIATNRSYKKTDGSKQEEVEFSPVVAFGKTGELIKQYVFKGNGLYIEGRLKTSIWEDKNGVKRYKTEIITENMQFGHKPSGSTASAPRQEQVQEPEIDASQIPY